MFRSSQRHIIHPQPIVPENRIPYAARSTPDASDRTHARSSADHLRDPLLPRRRRRRHDKTNPAHSPATTPRSPDDLSAPNDGAQLQLLRLHHKRLGICIKNPLLRWSPIASSSQNAASPSDRAPLVAHQPIRRPVRPGHMPRKKCRLQFQPQIPRDIAHRGKILHRRLGNLTRLRLKRFPQQKEPNMRQPHPPNHRKLIPHFPGVKPLPPIHRLANGPVIHTHQKRLRHRPRIVHGVTKSVPSRIGTRMNAD